MKTIRRAVLSVFLLAGIAVPTSLGGPELVARTDPLPCTTTIDGCSRVDAWGAGVQAVEFYEYLDAVYAKQLADYYEAILAAQAAAAASAGSGSCNLDPGGIDYGPGGYDGRYDSPVSPEVVDTEANGNYARRNTCSGACGKYQYLDSTWANWGGYASACDAPPAVQDERAAYDVNRGASCSNWSYTC